MRKVVFALATCLIFGMTLGTAFAENLEFSIPLPLTGTQAKFGEIEKRSYEMAMAEINAIGGIKGKQLVLRFEDSQGKPEISRTIAEKIIDVNKQPIIFGEYSSSSSKAVAAVAEERKTPYIVVTGAADDITQQNYKYVYRICPSNAYYASGLISYMATVVKPKSIAILYESSDFGSSGAEEMAKSAEKAGMKVMLKEKYEKGAVDFKPVLSAVKAAAPDVIYMVSYVMDASLLIRQIKELRIEAKLYAGGAAGFAIPEFVENSKEAAEYVVTATLWSPQLPFPGTKEFAEGYKTKFGSYPSYHGAEAYATLYLIKDVLERAAAWTTEDIKKALDATDLKTAFGPIKFESKDGYQNQNFMETFVLQILNGKHETIWPEKYASAKYVFPIPTWRERK